MALNFGSINNTDFPTLSGTKNTKKNKSVTVEVAFAPIVSAPATSTPKPLIQPFAKPMVQPVAQPVAQIALANKVAQAARDILPAHNPSCVIDLGSFLDESIVSLDKLNFTELTNIIEGGREMDFKAVFGSCKNESESTQFTTKWTELKYRNQFNYSSTNRSSIICAVQSTISGIILRKREEILRKQKDLVKTIILVSGDGSIPFEKVMSLPEMLDYLINYDGLYIELWSFSKALSPGFIKLQGKHPTKVTINFLDGYIDRLKM
jgi:hypothetical protein